MKQLMEMPVDNLMNLYNKKNVDKQRLIKRLF